MSKNQYFSKMLPYAKQAEKETGVPYYWVMAQWAYETANGTNRGSTQLNNHAGIKYSQYAPAGTTKDGMYAKYPTMDLYIKDYKRVMSLSYYKPFTANTNVSDLDLIRNFAKTPWAETKYNEQAMLNNMALARQLGEGIKINVSPIGGSNVNVNVPNVNVNVPNVDNLSAADLKQWAVVGLSLAVALSLIPKK